MSAVPVSVVIICFNAAATIQRTLRSACLLTNDVIVVDSGSTDGTQGMVEEAGAKLVQMEWQGFGANKNRGNSEAKNNWILSVDADEELSEELITTIHRLHLTNTEVVYKIKRLNYLNNQPIYHGGWGNDWTIRLFNRKVVQWNNEPVHEDLILSSFIKIKKLDGWLHHYTSPNLDAYNQKLEKYALLVAEKYYVKDVKGVSYKIYLSPLLSFLKSYIFRAGLLDKKAGWQLAVAHARYTFKKYKKLATLRRERKNES